VLPLLAAVVIPHLTASAAWEWRNAPNLVDIQTTKRNNVFYIGEVVSLKLNKTGASTYAIRDYYGNILEQGPIPSTLQLTPKMTASGWYKVYLYGADQGLPWGNSVGATTFCILRDDPNFPKMPAVSVQGGGGLMDAVTSSVLGYGPERFKVDNASNPGPEIARLDTEVAMAMTYYKPFDPIRKREILIAFPNGTTNQAGVRQIVEHFKGKVKYWEPRNEPNFFMGAAAFVNNEQKPFYQLVKSVDPSMKVLGPGAVTVGPNMFGFNQEFFAAGGAQWVDGFSFHAYNNVNGDLNLTRMSLDQVNQWLKTYNATGLEKWQTEQGYMAAAYGAYQPRLQGRWTMLQMMVYEQYGIPKERNHYWYSKSGGYWDHPMWLQNEDNTLNPAAVLLRVYSEELYGTNFNKAYDFGNPGNKLIVGNLFTGPNKQVAAFMTSGETSAQLDLTITGATSVKVISPFGREQVVPVVNGKLALQISELPSYVEFAGTLSVAPMNWGQNLAVQTGVSASTSGSTLHPEDSTIPNSITKTFNGKLDTWYWTQAKSDRLWESNFSSFPGWFELRLPTAQSIDRVVIYTGVLWQMDGSLLDYELQVDQGGQWVSLGRVTEPELTSRAYTMTNRTTVDSYYSERCVFTHSFAPVTTQKIRLLVNNTTYGGYSNQMLRDAGTMGGVRQFSLREIEVYRSGSVVAQNVAPTGTSDTATCYLDSQVVIPVLSNDTDPDNGPSPLSLASVSAPGHGTANIVGGQVVYKAAAGYSGPDSFTYTVSDGAATASATVNVTVLSTPPPVGTEINGLSGEYFNNADFTAPVFTRVDTKVDNNWGTTAPDPRMDPTTFSVRWSGKVQPRYSETYTFYTRSDDGVRLWVNGQLLIDNWSDHANTLDQASITLVAGQKYDVKLEYYQGGWDALISLLWSSPSLPQEVIPTGALFTTGTATNLAPVAANDSATTNVGVPVLVPVLANDSDPDAGPQPLSVASVSVPAHGTAAIATGGVLYTPVAGYSGADEFTYRLSDGSATTTAIVSMVVKDAPPVAVNDSATTNEGASVIIPVLANDSDPDGGPKPLSISAVSTPARGTAAIVTGGVSYMPVAGFYGTDPFTYTVSDGALTASATVAVSVNSTAKAYDLSGGGLTAALVGASSGSSRVLANGSWELNATGLGATGTTDALRMEASAITGDFRTVVRVQGIAASAPLARVGLMLRESSQVGARTAMLAVSPSNQNVSGARLVAGGTFTESIPKGADATATVPNAWLMMERTGDNVRLSVSSDGANYRPVASYTLTGLASSVQAGLFAASGAADQAERAVVSDWALTRPVASTATVQKGLQGVYFAKADLTLPAVARVDDSVNFDWSSGSPHPVLTSDNFSARWTGQVIPSFTEKYTFYTQSDDGVRLWVNGQLLVDNWTAHPLTENSGSLSLQAGLPYELKLEYFEAGGSAAAKLLWSSPSQPKQVIPGSAMRPAVTTVPIGASATASVRLLADGTREFSGLGTGLGAVATDQGGMLTQACSGDFQIAIRIRGITGGTTPRASVMLREGVAAGDRFAALQIAPDGTLSVVSRTKTGAVASVTPVTGPLSLPNAWLLIERRADQLSLAVSTDDITYRKVGNVVLPGLSQLVQIGAFLGSGSSTTSAKVILGDYELSPVAAAGLTGQYFGARDLTGLRLTRKDATVDFNWGTATPDPTLPVDVFSVRWTGRVIPKYTQTYAFSVQSDDGVRLWVNGQLLIDNWTDHALTENTGNISLVAGKAYDLKLEYYENTGGATVRLLWASPSQLKEVIPATQLSTP
jgi:hypothetical protein